MKYFSVPSDFKIKTLENYLKLNDDYKESKVNETYGNLTVNNFLGSGRNFNDLPIVNWKELKMYVEQSRKHNIGFNYTINGSHIRNLEFAQEGVEKIKNFLNRLGSIGVNSLTISLPSIIEIAQLSDYKFKIKVSTIGQIDNVNKALRYKEMGVDKIVTAESINRKFSKLRAIRKAFGEKVEIIINSICNQDCIYRMYHYNQASDDSINSTNEVSSDFYKNRCLLVRYNDKSNILKMSWVRPEDLKHYYNIGIKYFKIQGRHAVHKGDPIKTLRAYFNESYDGNLIDLLYMFMKNSSLGLELDNKKLTGYIDPFLKDNNFCNSQCHLCNYCGQFVERNFNSINFEQFKEISNNLYADNDKFTKLIENINSNVAEYKNDANDIEFDL